MAAFPTTRWSLIHASRLSPAQAAATARLYHAGASN